ncbi:MAG: DUF1850 domain-containing protein [Propionivibrio sp.]|jgi:hypothetical protein|nr:DUF1850 domain-containing protein [Propionivibrio sp.]
MALCISAGAISAALAIQSFTLAWMHSIEKIRWEEDWRVEGRQLHLVEARIKGAGAGMEPPPNATLQEGIWHYQPVVAPMELLKLAHSPYTTGYELCTGGRCSPLVDFLPGIGETATIVLKECRSEN